MWRVPSSGFQRGVTLVELIVTIVIIAIALTVVIGVYVNLVARSADPMIQQQAAAVADAYIEEIMARPFDGDSSPGDPRDELDNVQAYDGLEESPPQDQFGDPVSGLDDYTVSVDVGSGTIDGVSDDVLRIDVTVTHPANVDLTVNAYRLDF